MERIICIALLAAVLLPAMLPAAAGAAEDWRAELDAVLAMEPGLERDALVEKVAVAAPGWNEIRLYLQALEFGEPAGVQAVLDSTVCTDGVTRPWVLYVSTHYDASTPAPLIVRLHGGVGAPNIRSEPSKLVSEDEFALEAEERGWLAVFPMGQAGATWWDTTWTMTASIW
jgi:poly(3-hydroxybutyrate) depolymerase